MAKLLHSIIWFLAFFNGIIRLFHLNPAIIRVGIPVTIIILILISLKTAIKLPYFKIILMLLIVIIFSGLANSIKAFQVVDFISYLLFPYIYFIIIFNEKNIETLLFIKKLIILLFFVQIPASIVKYILVGQMEDYIGTISTNAGSLSTVIPMVATSYLFARYLFKRKKIDLLYIILFAIFGLIGEKRAIVFFVPLLLLILYIIFQSSRKVQLVSTKKGIFQTIILGIVLFYLMVIMNPSLTPEGKIGGSFNLKYVMEYSKNYNTSKDISQGKMSRFDGVIYFVKLLYFGDVKSFLFGEGAGKLLISESNPMLDFYGVRYAGRMGSVWIFLQIGLLGLVIYFYLLFKMLFYVISRWKEEANFHLLAFIGFWISIMIDTIIYSSSFIYYFVISGVYFYYFSIIYKNDKRKNAALLS